MTVVNLPAPRLSISGVSSASGTVELCASSPVLTAARSALPLPSPLLRAVTALSTLCAPPPLAQSRSQPHSQPQSQSQSSAQSPAQPQAQLRARSLSQSQSQPSPHPLPQQSSSPQSPSQTPLLLSSRTRGVNVRRAVSYSALVLWLVLVFATVISHLLNVAISPITPYMRREAERHSLSSKVAIVGLAHNIAARLGKSLPVLTETARYFNSTRYVFFENDSTDNTKEVLMDWHRAHASPKDITIVSRNLNATSAVSTGGFSSERFRKLAAYRNEYMEVLSQPEFDDLDYVIVTDLDLAPPSDAFLAALTPEALARDWAAVGAFGTRWHFGLHLPAPTYYDTLAFRDARFNDPFTYTARQQASWWLYHRQAAWVPVDSMFGGQVIYKARCLRQCRYEGGDCEHVALYTCMKKIPGCSGFYIAPEYTLSYGFT